MTVEAFVNAVYDCETNEMLYIPFTTEELAQREADAQAYEEQLAAEAEAQAQKQADIKAVADALPTEASEALLRLIGAG